MRVGTGLNVNIQTIGVFFRCKISLPIQITLLFSSSNYYMSVGQYVFSSTRGHWCPVGGLKAT